ncbi:MAG: 30S ribosomal protein S16, partial [Rubricoccaceae bacterium]
MAVKIRLRRMGRKKHPVYALVAADARAPRDGRFIEDLGRYEPVAQPARVSIKAERVLYWLQQGAQPSDTARSLLSREGILLHLHLLRKGKAEDEIQAALEAFRAGKGEQKTTVKTVADRRREALEAERVKAAEDAKRLAAERAEREAELERQRQEAEAAERAERE